MDVYVQDNSVLRKLCPAIILSKKSMSKNIEHKDNSVQRK